MTLDDLTDEIDRRGAGAWTFATRRQRKRLVALAIETLPESYAAGRARELNLLDGTKQRVRKLYRQRYGINPFLLLALEVIVQLVISWWLARGEHVQIANALRSQGRVI